MNIEEAKANIGKEVVFLKETKPYFGIFDYNDEDYKDIEGKEKLIIDSVSDEEGYICVSGYAIKPKHIALKHPTFKVGDQVVLDESTKPYTYIDFRGVRSTRRQFPDENKLFEVSSIEDNGNILLLGCGFIQPRHLKLAPQKEVKPPKNDVVEFNPLFCNGFKQTHPRLKDVTNLLQKLDIAFSVDENEIAFTVKYGDNSFQVMKHDQDALLYSEALFIASSLGKSDEFNLITGKQTKACILLQNNGYKVNLTMRGIEVL